MCVGIDGWRWRSIHFHTAAISSQGWLLHMCLHAEERRLQRPNDSWWVASASRFHHFRPYSCRKHPFLNNVVMVLFRWTALSTSMEQSTVFCLCCIRYCCLLRISCKGERRCEMPRSPTPASRSPSVCQITSIYLIIFFFLFPVEFATETNLWGRLITFLARIPRTWAM